MISILGNIGNAGFALPMNTAYPSDVNSQYLLAWNPTIQALDYVPYVGNASGDFTVVRDLTVTRDAVIGEDLTVVGTTQLGGTLAVTGIATFAQRPVFTLGLNPINVNGTATATSVVSTSGANTGILDPTQVSFQALKVLGVRQTGWQAATGTATRTTFATGAVTLPQLAERVKALIDDLTTHGLIGA